MQIRSYFLLGLSFFSFPLRADSPTANAVIKKSREEPESFKPIVSTIEEQVKQAGKNVARAYETLQKTISPLELYLACYLIELTELSLKDTSYAECFKELEIFIDLFSEKEEVTLDGDNLTRVTKIRKRIKTAVGVSEADANSSAPSTAGKVLLTKIIQTMVESGFVANANQKLETLPTDSPFSQFVPFLQSTLEEATRQQGFLAQKRKEEEEAENKKREEVERKEREEKERAEKLRADALKRERNRTAELSPAPQNAIFSSTEGVWRILKEDLSAEQKKDLSDKYNVVIQGGFYVFYNSEVHWTVPEVQLPPPGALYDGIKDEWKLPINTATPAHRRLAGSVGSTDLTYCKIPKQYVNWNPTLLNQQKAPDAAIIYPKDVSFWLVPYNLFEKGLLPDEWEIAEKTEIQGVEIPGLETKFWRIPRSQPAWGIGGNHAEFLKAHEEREKKEKKEKEEEEERVRRRSEEEEADLKKLKIEQEKEAAEEAELKKEANRWARNEASNPEPLSGVGNLDPQAMPFYYGAFEGDDVLTRHSNGCWEYKKLGYMKYFSFDPQTDTITWLKTPSFRYSGYNMASSPYNLKQQTVVIARDGSKETEVYPRYCSRSGRQGTERWELIGDVSGMFGAERFLYDSSKKTNEWLTKGSLKEQAFDLSVLVALQDLEIRRKHSELKGLEPSSPNYNAQDFTAKFSHLWKLKIEARLNKRSLFVVEKGWKSEDDIRGFLTQTKESVVENKGLTQDELIAKTVETKIAYLARMLKEGLIQSLDLAEEQKLKLKIKKAEDDLELLERRLPRITSGGHPEVREQELQVLVALAKKSNPWAEYVGSVYYLVLDRSTLERAVRYFIHNLPGFLREKKAYTNMSLVAHSDKTFSRVYTKSEGEALRRLLDRASSLHKTFSDEDLYPEKKNDKESQNSRDIEQQQDYWRHIFKEEREKERRVEEARRRARIAALEAEVSQCRETEKNDREKLDNLKLTLPALKAALKKFYLSRKLTRYAERNLYCENEGLDIRNANDLASLNLELPSFADDETEKKIEDIDKTYLTQDQERYLMDMAKTPGTRWYGFVNEKQKTVPILKLLSPEDSADFILTNLALFLRDQKAYNALARALHLDKNTDRSDGEQTAMIAALAKANDIKEVLSDIFRLY
ncbi:hypothetical protein AGMMS49949_01780 [Alphaproteobacteria bacterium]|nr:hypothetical protein AGMMS49949_01780 [Alphaproteobacteria bacterium]GHS97816.1 hypothetical protein AGMMS50296_5110 [Alphaproteobacteria bacterium]